MPVALSGPLQQDPQSLQFASAQEMSGVKKVPDEPVHWKLYELSIHGILAECRQHAPVAHAETVFGPSSQKIPEAAGTAHVIPEGSSGNNLHESPKDPVESEGEQQAPQ